MDDGSKLGCLVVGVGLTVLVAVLILLSGFGHYWDRIWGVYNEETRAQVYDQSRTYNQGMAVDLDNLCRQYHAEKDPTNKAGIAGTINLRSARYTGKLPDYIETCLKETRG